MDCHRTLQVVCTALFSLALVLRNVPLGLAQEPATVSPIPTTQLTTQVQQLTTQLLSRGIGGGGARVQSSLNTRTSSRVDIARQRKQHLLTLMDQAPNEVLLPKATKDALPIDIKPYIEEYVATQGILRVLIEDHVDSAKTHYSLATPNGRRYTLHFANNPPSLVSSTKVSVRGIILDQEMVLTSDQSSSGQTGLSVLTTPLSETLGEQKTLAILVNFLDEKSQPYQPEQVHDWLFNQTTGANAYFREVSFEQTWLTGKVVGWYTLPFAVGSDCPLSDDIFAGALQAAKASNPSLVLSEYRRFVVVFPYLSCYGLVAGFSTGGTEMVNTPDGVTDASTAWINGSSQVHNFIHELGHGFGLGHAASLNCNVVPLRTKGCNVLDYGNPFDVMGGGVGHVSAEAKKNLRWFSPENLIRLEHPGTYTYVLEPLEQPTRNIQAIEIIRPDHRSRYFVEYRQPVGFDSHLYPRNFDGVLINLRVQIADIQLLDMASGDFAKWTLAIGKTFTDPQGVTITPRAIVPTATGPAVQVEITIPPRNLGVPQVGFVLSAYEDGRSFVRGKGLKVVAYGDQPIAEISLFRDGELLETSSGPFSPFEIFSDGTSDGAAYRFPWDTTREIDRNVVLTARARNTLSVENSTSLAVTIDNTPPTAVRILSPVNGATVDDRVSVNVTGEDSNGVSTVSSVDPVKLQYR